MYQYLLLIKTDEEKEFFTLIYNKYNKEMFHTADIILRNTSDAEDVVHETFLTLIDNLDKLIGNEPHKMWNYIVTIVKNKCFNLMKRKYKLDEQGIEDYLYTEQYGDIFEKSLDTLMIESERKEVMIGLLKALKYPYKEVLLLQYYHEASVLEIAKILEKTPDNVRHISIRARRKLQSLIEESEIWKEERVRL